MREADCFAGLYGRVVDVVVPWNDPDVLHRAGDFASELLSAAPNPATSTTTITYHMPEEGKLQLEILDLLCNRIAVIEDGNVAPGAYTKEIDFAAMGLSAGTYLFHMTTPSHYSTLRVVSMQ